MAEGTLRLPRLLRPRSRPWHRRQRQLRSQRQLPLRNPRLRPNRHRLQHPNRHRLRRQNRHRRLLRLRNRRPDRQRNSKGHHASGALLLFCAVGCLLIHRRGSSNRTACALAGTQCSRGWWASAGDHLRRPCGAWFGPARSAAQLCRTAGDSNRRIRDPDRRAYVLGHDGRPPDTRANSRGNRSSHPLPGALAVSVDFSYAAPRVSDNSAFAPKVR